MVGITEPSTTMWSILRLPRIRVKVQVDDNRLLLTLFALIPARYDARHIVMVSIDVEHAHQIALFEHALHYVSPSLVVLLDVSNQLGSLLWLSRIQEE